ncbi:hypothetical protein ACFX13_046503 [Malus domestica]
MECRVEGAEQKWRLTSFYGNLIKVTRHLSWSLLKTLGQRGSLPWICMRDFNEILRVVRWQSTSGKSNGWFQKAIHTCQLINLGFVGTVYTQTDNRKDEVRCRLD